MIGYDEIGVQKFNWVKVAQNFTDLSDLIRNIPIKEDEGNRRKVVRALSI